MATCQEKSAILTSFDISHTVTPMTLGLDKFVTPEELVGEVRSLTKSELVSIATAKRPSPGRPESSVKRLSSRHRLAARLIAEGKTNIQVAAICNYTPQNIVILKQSPAMQDLIAHFRQEQDIVYRSVNEKLNEIAGEALDLIMEKIESAPEDISLSQAMELAKMGADRTGNGPQRSSTVSVTVDIADRLEKARARVAARTIDITPEKA